MAQDQKAIELRKLFLSNRYSIPLKRILSELGWSRSTFFRARDRAQGMFGVTIEYDIKH